MSLWLPSRREFIKCAPAAAATALLPRPASATVFRPLKFIVIGDWGRRGNDDQRCTAVLANNLASQGNDFTVTTGDNFYRSGVSSTTSSHWQQSYEAVYSSALKRNWLSSLGNHDYSGDVEAQIHYRSPDWHGDRASSAPWGWRMDGRWWDLRLTAFDRPDVHLFFVDTVTWRGKEKFPHNLRGDKIRLGDRAAQRAWLASAMRNSPAKIKLVIGHHGIYSVGKHGGQMEMKELDDVIRAGGASAYINGHDHCLYHIQKGGLDYVCSGAGSEVLRRYSGGRSIPGCVIADFCADPRAPEPYLPIWRSYVEQGGVAQFVVGHANIEFQFLTVNGVRTPPVSIRVRG